MATVSELPAAPVSTSSPEGTGSPGDVAKEKNDNWRFLEPQPVREDQVENAVKFLSHPKVKGSPVVYRRSFLEKKGLSREEIDEAFRRVPDPPSDSPAPITPPPPTGVVNPVHQVGQSTVPVGQPITGQVAVKSTSWSQMLLALGVLAAAGAGAGVVTKKYFIPKLREWILDIVSGKSLHVEPGKVSKPSPVEEATSAAAAAAIAAATAAQQVAGAMQEMAKSKSEDRKHLESIIRAVEAQTQEMKNTLLGMKNAVQSAEVTKYQGSMSNNFQSNGIATPDYWKGQTNGDRPTSASDSVVNTKTFNFGAGSDPYTGSYNNGQQVKSPSSASVPIHAPHSQSYLDVMAMLERGEKPPGIRDVNDKPPNPNQPPSNPRLQPRPKPWEKAAMEARPISPIVNADSGHPGSYDDSWSVGNKSGVRTELTIGSTAGSSSDVWWRKKVDTDSVFNPTSVKITEVDPVTETDIGTVQAGQPSSSFLSTWQSDGGRAGWVPPAVPLPVYPGAEEAIKRPKPLAGASARNLPFPVESGSAIGASSFLRTDENPSQVFVESLNNPMQSLTQPEQRDEVPGEQESEYREPIVVDPTLFKDVVQEDGDQQ